MVNREVTYARDINKSYMKIPAALEAGMDEKLMFRRMYQGILPMEKCYVNGIGQYWYNISGKQALDAYCRVHPINQNFFETIILRICSQLELLEWNLIDTSCLVVDPEFIFVNASGDEVSFILYPDAKGNFMNEMQQLMEYLLTKLNHSDREGVHEAYKIYDMTLTEGYSIQDLKNAIRSRRKKEETMDEIEIETEMETQEQETAASSTEDWFGVLVQKLKRALVGRKEEIPEVVYPEDEYEDKIQAMQNPTVCLTAAAGRPQGILLYEGREGYSDFELGQETCIIGKNPKVKLHINRDTISQFHAKVEYTGQEYFIEDMNSTNGTFVNDEMLSYKEKRNLIPGDILRFADVKYRFL